MRSKLFLVSIHSALHHHRISRKLNRPTPLTDEHLALGYNCCSGRSVHLLRKAWKWLRIRVIIVLYVHYSSPGPSFDHLRHLCKDGWRCSAISPPCGACEGASQTMVIARSPSNRWPILAQSIVPRSHRCKKVQTTFNRFGTIHFRPQKL